LCAGLLISIVSHASAEQEVILKSGTRLIGAVTIDAGDVLVQMADDKVRVSLNQVATIAAADSSPERQAQRLLFAALEARVTGGASNDVVALLAEAKRLAPEDPSVAYWCASTLVDAGFGKAANEVFTPRRDAIAKSYPGLVDQLAERIKRRANMEKMPSELVKRMDEINATAPKQSTTNDKRQLYVMFRVIDQNKQPIDASAFRIESRGEEENLESYDDGYFVLTFARNRYNRDEGSRLDVVQAGLEQKGFQFSAAPNRLADAGEFVVKRLDEKSKQPYRVQVTDAAGKPVSNAKVSLQITTQQGRSNEAASTTTDLDGRAELSVFPMKYTYSISATGFNYLNGSVEVVADEAKSKENKVQLHRAIEAKIRVAWLSTPINAGAGAGTTSGEGEIRATGSSIRYNQFGPNQIQWLRTNQTKDRLILQFMSQPFGGPALPGSAGWVRVVEPEGGATKSNGSKAAAEKYEKLDLKKVEEFKDRIAAPKAAGPSTPNAYPMSISVRAEPGKVYVGKMMQRDMRTGQPVEMSFKAIVDELSSDSEPVEISE
jgi:hypothetical protein